MLTNADQLNNKMDILKARIRDESPEIICINEVKPKNYRYKPFAADYSIDNLGYIMFENNVENDKGRGQVIYISKELTPRKVYIEENCCEEVLFLSITLADSSENIILCVYDPISLLLPRPKTPNSFDPQISLKNLTQRVQ